MFLFIVGLEVDVAYVVKNITIATTVGLGSIVIPFGLGAALSVGLFNHFCSKDVSFGTFLLFVGLSMAVTEFPVLARILSELGLMRERVGSIVIAAGVGNDLISWILLALAVTLSHSSKAINTLYIILLTVGWILALKFVVQPLLTKYLRYSGGIENGPSESDMAVIVLLILVSSFYTDIIGVHSIFGAFLIGIIIPRQNSFVVRVTEKLEDFISVILLPLYFTVAGLEIDLGLLNDGITWGYIFAIIFTAIGSKLIGCAIPARLHGLRWRESFTVGTLMSCKGAVEIVILEIGLHAGILSRKLFSMLVIMAIVTTFLTAPVTLKIYPVWYREKVELWRNNEINWDGSPTGDTRRSSLSLAYSQELYKFRNIVVVLDDLHSMSATLILTQLLAAPKENWDFEHDAASPDINDNSNGNDLGNIRSKEIAIDLSLSRTQTNASSSISAMSKLVKLNIHVFGIRLVELSQRTAPLIQLLSENSDQSNTDPILKVLNIFAGVNQIPFSSQVAVTAGNDRSHFIISMASSSTDFILLTWEDMGFHHSIESFDTGPHRLASCGELFETAKNPIGLLIDRGFSLASEPHISRRLYVPFFGDKDSKQALATSLHLANNAHVSVVIDIFSDSPGASEEESNDPAPHTEDLEMDYVNLVLESCDLSIANRVKVAKQNDFSSKYRQQRVMQAFRNHPRRSDLVILGRAPTFLSSQNDKPITNAKGKTLTSVQDHEPLNLRKYVIGELANEYLTLPKLNCSFLVCSAMKSHQSSTALERL